MLLVWDLGVSSLVLVVCLVFPVIGLLIRRQWLLAATRREEIRRLLIFAQEDAARVELEASASYGYGTIPVSDDHHCAVCYCPTKTRCARCKAVRYCSGKCQIIHWRQGHKDKCRPPSITYNTENEENNSYLKVEDEDQGNTQGDKLEAEDWQHAKPASVPSGESISSDSTSCLEDSHGSIADIKAELLADKEEANSVAETSGSSFSGFSSSSPSNDSSDDVSVCESMSSFDSERLAASLGNDIAVETLETNFGSNVAAPPQSLSPKFTCLVESADYFGNLSKLKETKPQAGVGEDLRRSNGLDSNAIYRHNGSVARLPVSSSGFWERSLECIEPIADAHDDSALPQSSEDANSNLSDSGSSVCFSFSSEESPPEQAKVGGVKNPQAVEAAMENDKPCDRVTVSESSCSANRNVCSSSASSSIEAKPSLLSATSSVDLPYGMKGVATCTSALDVASSSPLDFRKSNDIAKDPYATSYPLKNGESRYSPSKGSDADIRSGAAEYSALNAKASKAPDSETRNVVTPHATSSINEKNGLKTSVLKIVDKFKNPAVTGSKVVSKHGDKEHFYDSFVKLYNWKKGELRPCGLINCGNSCYANVVLQCLMFTPPLTAYFLQGFHSKACLNKDWCFTCEFENLVLKAKEGRSPLSPIGILSQLQNIGIQLGNGREEDAHEFLRYAVDALQSICIKKARYDNSLAVEGEETSLVGLTFGGYLRSKIKCIKCQSKSERHERMMDLTVEIEGNISTLEEALRRFTRTEILDGENKYKCGRCKSYERAKKKLKILEPPNVLTIALKRFQSGKFGKLNKSIRFPETLDLAPYVSGRSDKSHVYRLYGVVIHLDIMNAAFSGHYICYIKNPQDKWYKLDDSIVTTSELDRVLTKGAYMLFYARCSPRPPRSICNKTVSSDQKSKAFLSKPNAKNTISLSRSPSTNPSIARYANSPNVQPPSIKSFYSKFHKLQRILEEDSSSVSSSLFSSNSDECSCSTGSSTRDSTSTDEFADFIFGSCYDMRSDGKENDRFLHSDNCKRTLLGNSSSSSSSFRETDVERPLGRANPS